eukprot:4036094-Pleurochrysis_carterae.AAC.1
MDPYRVARARDRGLPVFYGDARRPDVLQAQTRSRSRRRLHPRGHARSTHERAHAHAHTLR